MSPHLNKLKSRLAHIERRIGCCDQIIRNAVLSKSEIAVAVEDRATLAPERELLADQITAIEAFETAKREQLLTENP